MEESQPKEAKKLKKKLVPEDNKMQISMNKNLNFYTFLSKIFLKRFPEIELHALGQAISVAARLGERLKKFGLGDMTKIQTLEFTPEPRQGDNRDRGDRPLPKKVKIIITVRRDTDFFNKVDTKDL